MPVAPGPHDMPPPGARHMRATLAAFFHTRHVEDTLADPTRQGPHTGSA